MNRSAIENTALLLIITIAGAALLAWLLLQLLPVFLDTTSREACRLSVIAQRASQAGPIDSPYRLECERYYIIFEDDGYTVHYRQENPLLRLIDWDGKHEVRKGAYEEPTAEIVHEQIVQEMRACWSQFLQGKTRIFSEDALDVWNNKKMCFVCDELHFDLDEPREFDGFIEYLKTHNDNRTGISYYDSLLNDPTTLRNDYYTELDWEQFYATLHRGEWRDPYTRFATHWNIDPDPTIRSDQRYYIVFVREGGGWLNQYVAAYWDGFLKGSPYGPATPIVEIAKAALGASDASDATFWMGLINETNLENDYICEEVVR